MFPEGPSCFNFNENLYFNCRANKTNIISIAIEGFGSMSFIRNSNKFDRLGPFDLTLLTEPDPKDPLFTTFEVMGNLQNATNSFNISCVDSTSKEVLSFIIS